jgi:hypothetical protein
LVVGPIFFVARAFTAAPVLPLASDEVLLAERPANHFLRGEGRGGKLLVTSKRLAFRPHRFNVQLDTWSLPLKDVERLECEGARLLLVYGRGLHDPSWIVAISPASLKEYVTNLTAMPESARADFKFGSTPPPRVRELQF